MKKYFSNPQITRFVQILIILALFFPPCCLGAFDGQTTTEELLKQNVKFTGDLDGMTKDRIIRVLMPYSKTFFFFDGVEPKGLAYEQVQLFKNFLNKKLKAKHLKLRLLVIPTSRDKLISQLKDGYGDIALGNLTITESRLKLVAFSDSFISGIDEILVTHKSNNSVKTVFDLSGKQVVVRKSSSYYDSLLNLNKVLASTKKPPVKIVAANENLEDEDLLEMINADIIPMVIIDKYKGDFWAKILPNIALHPEITVNSGGRIGWAVRKNNPQLKQVINEFVKTHKQGTHLGNVILNRYMKSTKYITDSLSGKEIQKFRQAIELFKKYGKEYDFDYLMLAALAYQESRIDQSARSHVGAVGVMQILPTTASDKNVSIPDIEKIEPNIHAGTKYLRFMADRYFGAESGIDPFNRALFSFASYNAGPAKISKMRKETEETGLDPNVWFNNVEVVAAKKIGRETVQYVSNILKYYVAYKLLSEKLVTEKPQK